MFAKNYGVRCPRRNHFRSKLPLVAYSEITLNWSQMNLFARLSVSHCQSGGSGANWDSAVQVGFPSTILAFGWIPAWMGVYQAQSCLGCAKAAFAAYKNKVCHIPHSRSGGQNRNLGRTQCARIGRYLPSPVGQAMHNVFLNRIARFNDHNRACRSA